LSAALASSFPTESVVVLANRQPFSHDWMPGQGIVVSRSSGGLVTALEPATVRVLDCVARRHTALRRWTGVARAIRDLLRWPGLGVGTTAVIKPHTIVAG
jgi:trehalose-6-phosphate synthase